MGTSKLDWTEDIVRLWRTTDLRSPLDSVEPDRSVNFLDWSMERSASGAGDQVPLVLRRQRSPSEARMETTKERLRG